jgi:hypothetical protein
VQSTDAQLATVVVEMAFQLYLLLAVAVEMACLLWACDWYPAYRYPSRCRLLGRND